MNDDIIKQLADAAQNVLNLNHGNEFPGKRELWGALLNYDAARARAGETASGASEKTEDLARASNKDAAAQPSASNEEAPHADEYKIAFQEGHFEGYQQAMRESEPDGYLYGDHEHTFDCPDDAAMMGNRKVGDRYTVTAVFYEQRLYEIVKVADDVSDDWEVRLVSETPVKPAAAAQPSRAEVLEQAAMVCDDIGDDKWDSGYVLVAQDCAAQIRALKDTTA